MNKSVNGCILFFWPSIYLQIQTTKMLGAQMLISKYCILLEHNYKLCLGLLVIASTIIRWWGMEPVWDDNT